jgi:hypothetical protein
MLQAIAGLGIAALAPQQPGQLVARLGGAGAQRQQGEQRPVLLAREVDRLAAGQPQLEAAEEREFRRYGAALLFCDFGPRMPELTHFSRSAQRSSPARPALSRPASRAAHGQRRRRRSLRRAAMAQEAKEIRQ